MTDIVVIGSLNADFICRVHRLPKSGETVHCYDFLPMLGGKGGNQAAAVARLGGKVAMVGRVGNDPFGPRSIENLAQQGVDTSHVLPDAEAVTGTAVGILPDRGGNRIFVSKGANGRVSREDVDRAQALISGAKMLVLQFEIPLETVEYATEVAARHAVKVILNPAPGYAVTADFLRHVDYLIPNETEAGILAGVEVKDVPTAKKAALKLREHGVPVVIITLGSQGALISTAQETIHEPARKVTAVDPTAAGDAFIGGLAVALARSMSLREAVRYANCAGALTTTKVGSQISLPWADEVQKLYQSHDSA